MERSLWLHSRSLDIYFRPIYSIGSESYLRQGTRGLSSAYMRTGVRGFHGKWAAVGGQRPPAVGLLETTENSPNQGHVGSRQKSRSRFQWVFGAPVRDAFAFASFIQKKEAAKAICICCGAFHMHSPCTLSSGNGAHRTWHVIGTVNADH